MMVATRKGEIDTKPPFRSVKEAVSLFADKLLYASQFKQSEAIMENRVIIDEPLSLSHEAIEAELEETKQNLQKAKEETMSMAHCLSSLQEELELTRQELQQLKQESMGKHHPIMQEEEEEAVIIKNNVTKFDDDELQKKRYETFANTPSLTHIISPSPQPLTVEVEKLKRHHSFGSEKKKKNKIKPLMPLIGFGGIFSKKKGNNY
ncbi:WEB family protein At1g75720 [Arachis stenosperma]|uniref:WEB family protein At1g75720 n=1 Tax=Arachis stenosperma TaxID=217475 RepID=UPI0025ACEE50|nr:WEB family protein At1g75720 [Arachis stenosperma]